MTTFIIVWITLALLIFAGHVFYVGYNKVTASEREFILNQGMIISLFWPVLLVAASVVAPFLGIYYLGKHLGR